MNRKTKVPAGAPREEALLKALGMGCTRRAACAVADISEDTFARMLKDADFADAVRKAEGEAEATYTTIIAEASVKSWQAAAWWLERRKYEDFGRRDRVEMTVDLRQLAAKVAEDSGLDPDSVVAEAERILSSAR